MRKLHLDDLIAAADDGVGTLDQCLYGFLTLMQLALNTAHTAHLADNDRLTIRHLRQAMRNVAPFLRAARGRPDLLPDCGKLLRVALCLADAGIERARVEGFDSSGYLGIAITCHISLARIIERQAQASRATASSRNTQESPSASHERPASTQDHQTAHYTDPEPPHPRQQPLTQRAKWLAEQRRRNDRKRQPA